MTFRDFSLSDSIVSAVETMNFVSPSPIQEAVIPLILEEEKDIVALAQTGTGKTAAFGLPLIEKLRESSLHIGALVLCPTRELALQIRNELRAYAAELPKMRIEAVYGGAAYGDQIRALQRGVDILVATPGRLVDLINKGKADLSMLQHLVLDEADIMLNMGFKEELDAILETLLLSATMPNEVARIATTYMKDPETIRTGRKNAGTESVEHIAFPVHWREKYSALKRLVDYHPEIYGIVFCRTKASTQEIADKLVADGYQVEALHGDLSQSQRELVMRKFKRRSTQLIVATDIAARGLDVQELSHVIHYDLPDEIDIYTHRSGRTGRAGKSGTSYVLVTPKEKRRIKPIERVIQRPITYGTVPEGKEIFQRHLYDFADKLLRSDSREADLEELVAGLDERLGDLSREELLRKIVSMQFEEIFSYYRDLPGMSPVSPKDEDRRQDRRSSGNYKSGKRERGTQRYERAGKPGNDKRQKAKNRPNRGETEPGFESVRVNLGKRDKVAPPDLIGLVNQSSRDRNIEIGRINIRPAWSTLQVEDEHAASVAKALDGFTYRGRTLRAQLKAS